MGISFLTRGRLAEVFNGRVIADLIHEYRWHIRFFAAVFMGSVFAAIAAYKLLGAAPNDWRPAAVGFGGGVVTPLAILYLVLPRQRFAEFWVAMSAKESFRPWLMSLLVVFSAISLAAGVAGYL